MSFKGFGPDALPFFKALAFHQTREWFEENRVTYETQVKAPMGDLVEDLAAAFARAGLPLKGDRKASLFRLNRDIRFSKDKNPYKTHAGAVLTRGGAKDDPGLFYIHVAPDECFAAAGFYHPEPAALASMRRAIARAPGAYHKMARAFDKAGLVFRAQESLKRPPREFAAIEDAPTLAAILRKSHVCSQPIERARIASPDLVGDLLAFGKKALPLLQWGWSAIADTR
jgi:uncharacterized protein (TIGR02453 family)